MENIYQNELVVPKGILMAIGGKESKGNDQPENKEAPDNFTGQEILKTFVQLTEKENPLIEVITTASSLAEESFSDYRKVFTELGVTTINHIHHKSRKELLADNLEQRVNAADAFFFSGGDQLLLSSVYGGSIFLKHLKERYIGDKIVIAGTSAGAMALSTPMIYAGSKEVHELGGEIRITTGLEFLKDVCIDTHFVHRGRFIRLAQVIATNPTSIGIGIEEDTAIIVRKGTETEMIGSGTIIIFEGYEISETNVYDFGSKKPISIRDLRVHILSKGDRYTIKHLNPPHL
ncbi:MAG: cyanophycinase [Segetibacter sp.]|nr:cyanophycinase [Segetibacter sp.]